jgi:hypothetical protein
VVVVAVYTHADSDDGLPPVKVQGNFADYSPAEVDIQVESVEAVMAIDHQDNSVEEYKTYLDNIPAEEVVAGEKVLEQVVNYS